MKLLRWGESGRERPGLCDAQGTLRDLSGVTADIDGAWLAGGGAARVRALDPGVLPVIEPGVRIGCPVARSGKYICIGLNYSDHAAETGQPVPQEPILFSKSTTAIQGPDDPIVIPRGSRKTDWEVELAFVIGRRARYVREEHALTHVAGYCVANDVSERSFQLERGGQWMKGKGCDTFGPLGPWLVTPDEIPDPLGLAMWLEVNGRRHQDGSTRTMIFKPQFLVHYISQFMTLEPGDIISTGTPPGVGMGLKPPRFLAPGDRIRLGIEGLGEQRQEVRAWDSSSLEA
jgi:2-keto-4-pentenoate hydratase/2-oxohepta-3-ene-1,7-dioic acid hydratase in catechol pathway